MRGPSCVHFPHPLLLFLGKCPEKYPVNAHAAVTRLNQITLATRGSEAGGTGAQRHDGLVARPREGRLNLRIRDFDTCPWGTWRGVQDTPWACADPAAGRRSAGQPATRGMGTGVFGSDRQLQLPGESRQFQNAMTEWSAGRSHIRLEGSYGYNGRPVEGKIVR